MNDTSDQANAAISNAANELLETWERLSNSHKVIGGSCSCGAHGLVLRLADFEQDIGDYLYSEGEQHQRRDVLTLLQANARSGDQWSIVHLLERLADGTAAVDMAAANFVLERLPRTVQSFEELHRRR